VHPELDDTDARDGARLAQPVDPDRLLPGGPAETADWQDAVHWVNVYQELVSFTTQHLELAQQRLDSLPSPSDGLEGPDLTLIQAHFSHLGLRLDYWKRRSSELAPDELRRKPGHIIGAKPT